PNMLDQFTITTKGGVVLWCKDYASVGPHPVDSLVKDVLIQNTRTESSSKYISGAFTLQWTFANELNVIFVAVYQKILQLPYIEDLLKHVKKHFVTRFEREIKQLVDSSCLDIPDFDSFDEEFEQVVRAVEDRERRAKNDRHGQPRKFEETKKFQATAKGAKLELEELAQSSEMDLASKGRRQGGKMRSFAERHGAENGAKAGKKGGKKAKENRVWEGQVTKESMQALDYSGAKSDDGDDSGRSVSALIDESSRGVRTADGIYEVADVAERPSAAGAGARGDFVLLGDDDDDGSDGDGDRDQGGSGGSKGSGKSAAGGIGSGFFGMFKSLTSGRVLTAEILAEPMARMREHLTNKNVAADISNEICKTVAKNMIGVRVGGLQNIRKLVEQSMETALTRILTPVS
ncbi:hypothetical protein LPJ75_006213, partial [Coemansia sp. RSA 2598]